jgi:hypothetical protein
MLNLSFNLKTVYILISDLFVIKKMSQNVWATIMPFGPVTLIFHWPKKKFRTGQRLSLISGTEHEGEEHFNVDLVHDTDGNRTKAHERNNERNVENIGF